MMSTTDIIANVIIRPALGGDAAGIREVCATALWLEPDAADLPAVLTQAPVALVAEVDGEAVGAAYGSIRDTSSGTRIGHLDLIAVTPSQQGLGIGAALLSAVEERLAELGAGEFRLGGNSPVYLWPAIDPRYTAMTCLVERAGYQRQGDNVNLIADLNAINLDTRPAERTLASGGIAVRLAGAEEEGAVRNWLSEGPFGGSSWPAEAAAAIASGSASCHVAVSSDGYIGFACQGVNRSGWFGPMGTLPASRRTGVGTVLLIRCLADIKAAGHATAQISWAGPIRYYGRAVGARIDRVFWRYGKAAGNAAPHEAAGQR